jgi:hypothetical protein
MKFRVQKMTNAKLSVMPFSDLLYLYSTKLYSRNAFFSDSSVRTSGSKKKKKKVCLGSKVGSAKFIVVLL